MNIIAYFSSSGVPTTGLTPTIRIRKLLNNEVAVNDDSMVEVGDGFYKYSFEEYDQSIDYVFRADGGPNLSNNDRYVYGSNNNQLIEERTSSIKLVTDKLQFDADNNIQSIAQNPELSNLDVIVSSRADQTSVNQIPLNSLLTNDVRLDNLDVKISSRSSHDEVQQNSNLINTLLDIEQGDWKIDPCTKQMIFYDRQNKEIMRFNLYNDKGVLSTRNTFKRVRQ